MAERLTGEADPWPLLEGWLADGRRQEGAWNEAFILATVSGTGRPSARAVVLRGVDHRGLVFFTDKASGKARDLAANPLAAGVFVWPALRRELRVEGPVTTLAVEEADVLFSTRPAHARLPLWAWRQGEVVADRTELVDRLGRVGMEYPGTAGDEAPRPPYWLGYRLGADLVEFWEERPHGLHDRIRHRRDGGRWRVERLAP